MRYLTKIIFITIALVVIVLLLVLYIMPGLSKSIEKSGAIRMEREKNTVSREKLGRLLSVRDEYNVFNAEYQKFSLELPSENNLSIFTDEIYDVAKYADVDISLIKYKEITNSMKVGEETEILTTEVSLVMEGSYYNILNFILTMENIPRIVEIKDVTLQSHGDEYYETLGASITAEIYYYKT